MSHRNRTPRTAALFLSLAVAGGALALTPAAMATSGAVHAKAVAPTEQNVTRLSVAKASAGDTILVHGTALASVDDKGTPATNDDVFVAEAVKFASGKDNADVVAVAGADVTALSTRVLSVKVPAAAKGTVTVLVGDAVKGPKFTYVATVDTDHDDIKGLAVTSEAGLADQTIVGDHFTLKSTKVLVGGKPVKLDATTPVSADGTTLNFDYPAGLIGVQDVVVTDNGATYYVGYVTYTAVKPTLVATGADDYVVVEGPTAVKLTGTNLQHVASVTYAGAKATFTKANLAGTEFVVTVPAGDAVSKANGKLVVTTKYGESATVTIPRVAAALPTVTSVTGAVVAGGEVTLAGTNLVGLKGVTVTSTSGPVKVYKGTKFVVAADGKSAKVTLPKLLDNTSYELKVTTLFASESAARTFTLGSVPGLAVTGVTASADKKVITITGTNLYRATQVLFHPGTGSDVTATTGIVVNSTGTQVVVTLASALTAETWDVTVTSTVGNSGTTGDDKLTIAAA